MMFCSFFLAPTLPPTTPRPTPAPTPAPTLAPTPAPYVRTYPPTQPPYVQALPPQGTRNEGHFLAHNNLYLINKCDMVLPVVYAYMNVDKRPSARGQISAEQALYYISANSDLILCMRTILIFQTFLKHGILNIQNWY